MIDQFVLKWVAPGHLVIRKDPPWRAPLHFKPIDFMIVTDQKMGENVPMHDGNLKRDQRNCFAII